jgi:uncharacterized protein YecT (DUF1311 family)
MIERTLFLLASFAVLGARAAPAPNCQDPMSNAELKMCAAESLKKAEAEMNVAYGKAIEAARERDQSAKAEGREHGLDKEPLLREAQRAWAAYRDASCKYQYQIYWGGSHAGLADLICMNDITTARIKELRELPGGDRFQVDP